MNMFTYSVAGTKLRIARIILSFIPIIGFIVPWAYIKSDAESIGFDTLGLFTDGKSLIDILSSFFGNVRFTGTCQTTIKIRKQKKLFPYFWSWWPDSRPNTFRVRRKMQWLLRMNTSYVSPLPIKPKALLGPPVIGSRPA